MYTLQVSDRLVTRPLATRGYTPVDPEANKVVVFQAQDAIVSLAYSGLAVVDEGGSGERATDHWIAEQLAGHPIDQAHNLGGPGYRYNLGYALKHLCGQLDANEYFRAAPIELGGSGYIWNKRMSRPMLCRIWQDAGRFRFEVTVDRTTERGWQGLVFTPAGVSVDLGTLWHQFARLGSDHDAAEQLLVNALRDTATSTTHKTIGNDCMSVLFKDNVVRIRYQGERTATGIGAISTPTPWIVTPVATAAPANTAATLTYGGLVVRVDGPGGGLPVREPRPGRQVHTILGFSTAKRRFGPPQPDLPFPPRFDVDGPPQAPATPATGRNNPCLCGSGKKYKKCCGA